MCQSGSGCSSFAQLPATHGLDVVHGLEAQVRTVHEVTTHRLQSLGLRLIANSEFAMPGSEAADAATGAVVRRAAEEPSMLMGCPRVRNASEAREWQAQGGSSLAWVDDYRRVFQHSLRCGEHEFFEQPVAHLIVLSSAEVDAASLGDAFRQVQQSQPQPRIIAQNTYSGDLPLYYVVLHDQALGGDSSELEQALGRLYGPGQSRLLTINSGANDAGAAAAGGGGGGGRGGRFTAQDAQAMRAFLRDFTSRFVIPCMERKIRALYATIVEHRKGFGNSLKSWFGGAQRTERVGVTLYAGGGPPSYTCLAIESQIRMFADMTFMLQDYDLAIKHYRMVRDDYKNDKANMRLAGTLEMIGVCLLLLKGSHREIETNLEQAVVLYQRERATAFGARSFHPSATCLPLLCSAVLTGIYLFDARACHENKKMGGGAATRATLLLCDCYQLWRRNLEASRVLLRASDHERDNDCRAAIMLELAGYCFLQMAPSQYRKYAFYLALAGFRYNLAQQRRHTVRCYSTALHVYDSNGWNHVEDHLNFALGRQNKTLEDYPSSMQYLMRLLRNCQQPAERQEYFIKEFVGVASRMRLEALEDRLHEDDVPPVVMGLPRVDDESISINVNIAQGSTRSSSQLARLPSAVADTARVEEAVFTAMEESLTGLYNVIRVANGGPTMRARKASAIQNCYVGEEVLVEVWIRNPLRTELALADLCLVCKLTNEAGTVPPSRGYTVERRQLRLPPLSGGEYHDTSTEIENLVDGPVELRVMPMVEGELLIKGLKWNLLGELPCQHTFALKGQRLNKTPRQRQSEQPQYSEDKRLELHVCPPMPLLRASFSTPEPSLLSGEIREIKLTLTNIGRTADMESVTVAISHPAFCFIGDGANDRTPAPPPCSGPGTLIKHPATQELAQEYSLVTLIGGSCRLPPDGSAEFTVWLYGAAPGDRTLSFVFYYDATPEHSNVNFRTLRHNMRLSVAPALSVEAGPSGSHGPGEEWSPVIRVNLVNSAAQSMTVNSMSCVSCGWLPKPETEVAAALEGHQQCSLLLPLVAQDSVEDDDVFPDVPRAVLHCCVPLAGAGADADGGVQLAVRSTTDGPVWQFMLRQPREAVWLRNWVLRGESEHAADVVQLGVSWSTAASAATGPARHGYSFVTTGVRSTCWQALPARGLSHLSVTTSDQAASKAGPGLKQHWQGRHLLIGQGDEAAQREATLDEAEAKRAMKAQRQAGELALMASKNAARCELFRLTFSLLRCHCCAVPGLACRTRADATGRGCGCVCVCVCVRVCVCVCVCVTMDGARSLERARDGRAKEVRAATRAPAELSPVQLVLELPGGSGCVAHDFAAAPLCELPVKVLLRNTSQVFDVTIELVAERGASSNAGAGGCMWAGITRQDVELRAHEQRTLALTCAFTEVWRHASQIP
eukprot:COSAG01_NODE_633_length_14669_cov_7.174056_8_plen_1413_part_00